MFKWILLVMAILYLVMKAQIITEGYKSTDAWDIIVVAGQSNSLGWSNEAARQDAQGNIASYNMNVFDNARDKTPHPRVFILERDPAWPLNANRVDLFERLEPTYVNNCGIYPSVEPMSIHSTSWNARPSIGFYNTFARRYADANPNKKVLIIHNGFEATGMLNPITSHIFIKESNIQWNLGGQLYKTMVRRVNKVLSWNTNNRVVAVLWSQGEADIDRNVAANTYRDRLRDFVNQLRTDLRGSVFPFLACGYPKDWRVGDALKNQYMTNLQSMSVTLNNGETSTGTTAVRPVTGNVVEKFGYISTVNVQCDVANQNSVHFNFAGLRELGERFWRVYNVVIK